MIITITIFLSFACRYYLLPTLARFRKYLKMLWTRQQWFAWRRTLSARFVARMAAAVLALYVAYLYLGPYLRKPQLSVEFRHFQQLQQNAGNQTGCRVPHPDPWDPSILKYYQKQKPLKCTAVQPQLTKFKEGVITFNKPEIDRLSLKCSIRPVIKGTQDNEAEYGPKIELDLTKLHEYALKDEFVEVNCDTTGVLSRNVYKYHYHHLQAKSLNVAGDDILPATLEHPPVIMLGLDSMSYGNFRRHMPLTYKRMQEMGFQDLPSHVKIGDNTYANWLAILTGKRGSAVKEFPGELPDEWHIWFDDFPFVWKNFTKNGYATMFAEDRPDIGTFNYFGELNGFKTAPTDHYFRSYWLAAFWSLVGRRSKPFCYDARPKHEIQLDYLENFLHSYRGQRHFAYWWTQDMSHDYLNAIGQTDNSYATFLKRNSPLLDDAITIVFSDHGNRYDSIRETIVGRLEARLPFLSIRLPKNIRVKYPHIAEALKTNAGRMTTQFDIYDTLLAVATGTYMNISTKTGRSYPLWHPVPETRICHEAHVPEDYCPCFNEMPIPVEEARGAAETFIAYLNKLLTAHNATKPQGAVTEPAKNYKCQILELANITYASVRLPPAKIVDDPQTGGQLPKDGIEIFYRIVIEAAPPSRALIEGLLVKRMNSEVYVPTGEVERNNKYGHTSHCVADRTLKKICHCLEVL